MNPHIHLPRIEMLAFAGGGNRCWWQAGVLTYLLERGSKLPQSLVGTSAGAAIAASCLTAGPEVALRACQKLYSNNTRSFDWRGLSRLELSFAHQQIYPAWIASFVNSSTFQSLKNAQRSLLVAVTRPAGVLGLTGSVALGTLAYLVDKKIWSSIHPRLPRFLGLRQEFIPIHQCTSVSDAQRTLAAAAAAPPFMQSVQLSGNWAFDGGYTDNAPIPQQSESERAATLVLLTRHYPGKPARFLWQGRTYWQPSTRVPVSTWDCTSKATVQAAFELGYEDAKQAIVRGAVIDR